MGRADADDGGAAGELHAVQRVWHTHDSHGQIMALLFRFWPCLSSLGKMSSCFPSIGMGRADGDDGGGAGELHAVNRVWRRHYSQGQILGLAYRLMSSKRFERVPLGFEWAGLTLTTAGVLASFTLTARDAFANLRDTLHDEAYG